MPAPLVGRAVPRKEARDKVTGRARYIDDLVFPDMLHGVTVRSPVARGRLKAIHFDPAIPWDEYVVVTWKDLPPEGKNSVYLILENDQPALVEELINHAEEPVVLIAHADKAKAEAARSAVRLEIEPLPAVLTIDESRAQQTVIWGEAGEGANLFKKYLVEKGDLEKAFAEADLIVEGEYETGAQEQLYIENNGVIARYTESEGVTIWGSLQCPYYVQKALMKVFGTGPEKTRIIQMETGGGFGGKEEYPSMIAAHAALLSRKAGKAVKLIYDRTEDMAATTKRHPSKTKHRTAVTKEGRILAMDIDFALDGGAYATLSQVVLSRGTIHAAGPYDVPNLRILSQAFATNHPPHGAFRGFGAPQSVFALERQLDKVARELGLAPEELRRRNYVKPGQTLATGQVVKDPIDMDAMVNRALDAAGWKEKKARFAEENAKGGRIRRGMGLATFMHGGGFTGSGEKFLASVVGVEATKEGKISVLAASTEIGQGTNTVFSQIVADALGVELELVDVAQPDTANVPNSGPTVASRTTMIVGKLVERAARDFQRTLVESGHLKPGYSSAEFQQGLLAYLEKFGRLRTTAEYSPPPGLVWDDATYRGDAYGAFAWAVYIAQVAVDLDTYETRVEDFVALQEVGKVIHPVLAAGQIEGGVVQGIGFSLYEKVVWKDGRMSNNRMTDYIIPTTADLGTVRVLFEELPYSNGPFGAKGLGELPMDGPAPAILNAVEDALGVAVNRVPMMPETLFEAVHAPQAQRRAAHG